MKESERIGKEITVEEVQRELDKYITEACPGTPRHMALGDFLLFGEQTRKLNQAVEKVSHMGPGMNQAAAKKELWSEELNMALTENRIRDRRLDVPGYNASYCKLQALWNCYSSKVPEGKGLETDRMWGELWRGFTGGETDA